jgi:hypothetical protein
MDLNGFPDNTLAIFNRWGVEVRNTPGTVSYGIDSLEGSLMAALPQKLNNSHLY